MAAQRHRAHPHERAQLSRPLLVEGELALALDGRECTVVADGSEIRVDVPKSLATIGALSSAVSKLALARELVDVLTESELTVTVVHEGQAVARFGAGAKSGIVGRLLGVPSAELYPKE